MGYSDEITKLSAADISARTRKYCGGVPRPISKVAKLVSRAVSAGEELQGEVARNPT